MLRCPLLEGTLGSAIKEPPTMTALLRNGGLKEAKMTNASGPARIIAGAASASRRGVLVAGAGGVFSLTLGLGRSVPAQQVQGPLNMLGWAEYVSPANIEAWEEMTGTRLIYDAYSSNDEMLSKLQLAGGASGYDIGMNTDFMIPLLINRELIHELDKSRLRSLANIDPDFLGRDFDPENNYTVPKSWGSQGYIYDREVIQREMRSWSDFVDAVKNEASGMVSLLDDPLAIAPLMWKDGESWNSTDEAVLDRVEKEVEELAPHIRTFNTYPMQDVANGTVKLAQNWNGYCRLIMQSANNPNLVFDYGAPKTELWLDSYHMPAGGEHADAAYSWLNFILEPERAAEEISYTGYASPVPGAREFLPEDVANDPLIFPAREVILRGERTQRNESYDRRIAIFTKFKAASAL